MPGGGWGGRGLCPHVAPPLLAELPQEQRERWEAFVSGPLAETNKKNTVDLVSLLRRFSSSRPGPAPRPAAPACPRLPPGAPQALTAAHPCPGEHAPPALLQRRRG